MAAVGVLIDYLRQLQRRGETHVRLDEEAREVLRGYFRAAQSRKGSSAPVTPPPAPVAKTPAEPVIELRGETPAEQLEALRQQAEDWEPARSLGSLRDKMVFAVGDPQADLMLIGEAPGYEEERRQEPFVGRAGEKLDQILKAMGLARNRVYISNICKFRPFLKNQTNNNRKPTRAEMVAFLPFVRAEIGIVKPKCIVALGATAAEGLLDQSAPITRLRGSWHTFEGIPLRVTHHPSQLLHNDAAINEKRKVWEDMLSVMGHLNMAISEKQQGFFGGGTA